MSNADASIATGQLALALARYADDVGDVPVTVAELAGQLLEATRRDYLARNAPARETLRSLRDSNRGEAS